MKFMIGQKVIYNDVICTICQPENPKSSFDYWIDNPEKGYKHGTIIGNIKPLPNGQL
jgi:hypothetical protein